MLRMNLLALALSIVWSLYPIPTIAQEITQKTDDETALLEEVTVSSTRTERHTNDVPNTVTVIHQKDIEREGVRDIKDLLNDEIDVSVRQAPTRFSAAGSSTGRAGTESINIRGLEGNQVLMLIDGIRVPNSFSFASFSTGRGDYIDVDGLKSAEILRGPASTQFGSDGLAGAVSFRTLDPTDVLKGSDRLGGFVRSGYSSMDDSWGHTLAIAGQNKRWQGLLLGSFRYGHELSNKGDNNVQNIDRTTPNPVDYDNPYLLGKAFFAVNDTNQLGLTFETQWRNQDTQVYSAIAKPPFIGTSALAVDTRDELNRSRVSLEHKFTDSHAKWLQRAETKVYWQNAQVNQFSAEDRNTAADRTRDNTYDADVVGVSSVMESNLTTLLDQRITYGFDWSEANITGMRDGTVPPFGETFPTKPFPDTTYTLAGAFVQSEIEMGSFRLSQFDTGAFSIIPALRFNYYELEPSGGNYLGTPVTMSDNEVTPRVGIVWHLDSMVAPYFQWAKGFRAPTPEQVNNGFVNLASGYTSVGNSNLKAERADSIELGLRGKLGILRYSIAAFDNSYDNFINQQPVSGSGTPADPTVFQYINLSKATIKGIEGRTEWHLYEHWTATAGIAYTEGDSEVNGKSSPIDTINPLKAVMGLRYDTQKWGTRATLTQSKGKEPSRVGSVTSATGTPTAQFTPESYTVLDLGAYWKPINNVTVSANLNNVFDTKYWRWSDVRGLADDSPVKDAYTAPERNVQVSVRYDF